MITLTDHLCNTISINGNPKRIISLVPSQTELLYDLGLDEEVVGITKFCIHPQHWFRTKQRVGGTKTVDINRVKQLHPDLIIANKEENVKSQIEELQQHFPVWISDINSLQDAVEMIVAIGKLVDKNEAAFRLIQKIEAGFAEIPTLPKKLKTAYIIWKDPFMSVGGNTYINSMLTTCGFDNVLSGADRYPVVTVDELKRLQCELLILSTEPFPFKEENAEELRKLMPDTKVVLADGEMFSWYGSRMQHAPYYFCKLITEIAN